MDNRNTRLPILNIKDEPVLIDTPSNGSSLLYSLALSFLLPVIHYPNIFEERFEILFGENFPDIKTLRETVREFINQYDGSQDFFLRENSELFRLLIETKFRPRLIDHIVQNQKEYKDLDDTIDENNLSRFEEKIKPRKAQGYPLGNLELFAAQGMLKCKIIRKTKTDIYYPIEWPNPHLSFLYLVEIAGDESEEVKYAYMMDRSIFIKAKLSSFKNEYPDQAALEKENIEAIESAYQQYWFNQLSPIEFYRLVLQKLKAIKKDSYCFRTVLFECLQTLARPLLFELEMLLDWAPEYQKICLRNISDYIQKHEKFFQEGHSCPESYQEFDKISTYWTKWETQEKDKEKGKQKERPEHKRNERVRETTKSVEKRTSATQLVEVKKKKTKKDTLEDDGLNIPIIALEVKGNSSPSPLSVEQPKVTSFSHSSNQILIAPFEDSVIEVLSANELEAREAINSLHFQLVNPYFLKTLAETKCLLISDDTINKAKQQLKEIRLAIGTDNSYENLSEYCQDFEFPQKRSNSIEKITMFESALRNQELQLRANTNKSFAEQQKIIRIGKVRKSINSFLTLFKKETLEETEGLGQVFIRIKHQLITPIPVLKQNVNKISSEYFQQILKLESDPFRLLKLEILNQLMNKVIDYVQERRNTWWQSDITPKRVKQIGSLFGAIAGFIDKKITDQKLDDILNNLLKKIGSEFSWRAPTASTLYNLITESKKDLADVSQIERDEVETFTQEAIQNFDDIWAALCVPEKSQNEKEKIKLFLRMAKINNEQLDIALRAKINSISTLNRSEASLDQETFNELAQQISALLNIDEEIVRVLQTNHQLALENIYKKLDDHILFILDWELNKQCRYPSQPSLQELSAFAQKIESCPILNKWLKDSNCALNKKITEFFAHHASLIYVEQIKQDFLFLQNLSSEKEVANFEEFLKKGLLIIRFNERNLPEADHSVIQKCNQIKLHYLNLLANTKDINLFRHVSQEYLNYPSVQQHYIYLMFATGEYHGLIEKKIAEFNITKRDADKIYLQSLTSFTPSNEALPNFKQDKNLAVKIYALVSYYAANNKKQENFLQRNEILRILSDYFSYLYAANTDSVEILNIFNFYLKEFKNIALDIELTVEHRIEFDDMRLKALLELSNQQKKSIEDNQLPAVPSTPPVTIQRVKRASSKPNTPATPSSEEDSILAKRRRIRTPKIRSKKTLEYNGDIVKCLSHYIVSIDDKLKYNTTIELKELFHPDIFHNNVIVNPDHIEGVNRNIKGIIFCSKWLAFYKSFLQQHIESSSSLKDLEANIEYQIISGIYCRDKNYFGNYALIKNAAFFSYIEQGVLPEFTVSSSLTSSDIFEVNSWLDIKLKNYIKKLFASDNTNSKLAEQLALIIKRQDNPLVGFNQNSCFEYIYQSIVNVLNQNKELDPTVYGVLALNDTFCLYLKSLSKKCDRRLYEKLFSQQGCSIVLKEDRKNRTKEYLIKSSQKLTGVNKSDSKNELNKSDEETSRDVQSDEEKSLKVFEYFVNLDPKSHPPVVSEFYQEKSAAEQELLLSSIEKENTNLVFDIEEENQGPTNLVYFSDNTIAALDKAVKEKNDQEEKRRLKAEAEKKRKEIEAKLLKEQKEKQAREEARLLREEKERQARLLKEEKEKQARLLKEEKERQAKEEERLVREARERELEQEREKKEEAKRFLTQEKQQAKKQRAKEQRAKEQFTQQADEHETAIESAPEFVLSQQEHNTEVLTLKGASLSSDLSPSNEVKLSEVTESLSQDISQQRNDKNASEEKIEESPTWFAKVTSFLTGLAGNKASKDLPKVEIEKQDIKVTPTPDKTLEKISDEQRKELFLQSFDQDDGLIDQLNEDCRNLISNHEQLTLSFNEGLYLYQNAHLNEAEHKKLERILNFITFVYADETCRIAYKKVTDANERVDELVKQIKAVIELSSSKDEEKSLPDVAPLLNEVKKLYQSSNQFHQALLQKELNNLFAIVKNTYETYAHREPTNNSKLDNHFHFKIVQIFLQIYCDLQNIFSEENNDIILINQFLTNIRKYVEQEIIPNVHLDSSYFGTINQHILHFLVIHAIFYLSNHQGINKLDEKLLCLFAHYIEQCLINKKRDHILLLKNLSSYPSLFPKFSAYINEVYPVQTKSTSNSILFSAGHANIGLYKNENIIQRLLLDLNSWLSEPTPYTPNPHFQQLSEALLFDGSNFKELHSKLNLADNALLALPQKLDNVEDFPDFKGDTKQQLLEKISDYRQKIACLFNAILHTIKHQGRSANITPENIRLDLVLLKQYYILSILKYPEFSFDKKIDLVSVELSNLILCGVTFDPNILTAIKNNLAINSELATPRFISEYLKKCKNHHVVLENLINKTEAFLPELKTLQADCQTFLLKKDRDLSANETKIEILTQLPYLEMVNIEDLDTLNAQLRDKDREQFNSFSEKYHDQIVKIEYKMAALLYAQVNHLLEKIMSHDDNSLQRTSAFISALICLKEKLVAYEAYLADSCSRGLLSYAKELKDLITPLIKKIDISICEMLPVLNECTDIFQFEKLLLSIEKAIVGFSHEEGVENLIDSSKTEARENKELYQRRMSALLAYLILPSSSANEEQKRLLHNRMNELLSILNIKIKPDDKHPEQLKRLILIYFCENNLVNIKNRHNHILIAAEAIYKSNDNQNFVNSLVSILLKNKENALARRLLYLPYEKESFAGKIQDFNELCLFILNHCYFSAVRFLELIKGKTSTEFANLITNLESIHIEKRADFNKFYDLLVALFERLPKIHPNEKSLVYLVTVLNNPGILSQDQKTKEKQLMKIKQINSIYEAKIGKSPTVIQDHSQNVRSFSPRMTESP